MPRDRRGRAQRNTDKTITQHPSNKINFQEHRSPDPSELSVCNSPNAPLATILPPEKTPLSPKQQAHLNPLPNTYTRAPKNSRLIRYTPATKTTQPTSHTITTKASPKHLSGDNPKHQLEEYHTVNSAGAGPSLYPKLQEFSTNVPGETQQEVGLEASQSGFRNVERLRWGFTAASLDPQVLVQVLVRQRLHIWKAGPW